MIGDVAAALEATALARALRGSAWAYPLVNAAHILGVALLVGGAVPLALRQIGTWRSVPAVPLLRALGGSTLAGFLLAFACGFLLFSTRATAYVGSGLFIAKMSVLVSGIAVSLALRRAAAVDPARPDAAASRPPSRTRTLAWLTLLLWPTVLILGRLVGYF